MIIQMFRQRATHAGKATIVKDIEAGTTLATAAAAATTAPTRTTAGKSSYESGHDGEERSLELHFVCIYERK